jgi:hypothetical protein
VATATKPSRFAAGVGALDGVAVVAAIAGDPQVLQASTGDGKQPTHVTLAGVDLFTVQPLFPNRTGGKLSRDAVKWAGAATHRATWGMARWLLGESP